jgi:hypothetical protein
LLHNECNYPKSKVVFLYYLEADTQLSGLKGFNSRGWSVLIRLAFFLTALFMGGLAMVETTMAESMDKTVLAQPAAPKNPLLIELFTSQGCSSCPPAEAVLNTWGMDLFKAGKALPLAFHVDYWDNIGWKDPFSSPLFTARQRAYADALGDSSLYTPEMVVEGRVGFVGSDRSRAQQETAVTPGSSARLTLAIHRGLHSVVVKSTASFPSNTDSGFFPKLYAVIFENGLSTHVLSGENQGRNLSENFVVRNLKELNSSKNNDSLMGQAVVPLEANWVRNHLGVAVFAQDQTTQKILGIRWIYPVTKE